MTPFATGVLEVAPETEIYWETSGVPNGDPLLYLHGGPGSGLGSGGWRATYDTGRHLVVALDQRGCGASRPLVSDTPASLATNTTQALVSDIEALRQHLGIEHWIVAGVSWGSTLALAYALTHRERVRALVLAAVTTTSRDEVDWLTEQIGRVFPEEWDRFALASDRRSGERIVEAYARRLAGVDSEDRRAAAAAWDRWEAVHISLGARRERATLHDDPEQRLQFATLVTHYWSHDAFLPGDQAILARAGELADIPITLIHGRRDISGPAITAWRLHRAIPRSRLEIIEGDGHGGPTMWERVRLALG
jgi:proline iminopeptidase